ncbi:MAG: HEAT repeat domain-containing protein [Planctomycetes bacterium]|nr:HEAT repeat domain-containing protein [Planctomycetota bacterium]
MKTVRKVVLAAVAVAAVYAARGIAFEEEESDLFQCARLSMAPAQNNDTYVERKYAPDRTVDILHVAIDVTPDFKARTIRGVTSIRFAPIARALEELALDAIDLRVSSVAASTAMAGYSVTDEKIAITFRPPIPPGQETTVVVTYEAEPKRGLYFRTPELGYPEQDTHLFSQGESHEAPYWFPSYDYPNERSTSEVTCRVPKDMTVLSNGSLVGERVDPNTGLKAVTWLQSKPHVNYLIALAAGRFAKIEGRHGNVPLAFYTPASMIGLAKNSFEGTADMVAFYEKEIGIPYPWNKYDQVVVRDFVAGGMENTTLTILTDGTLFTDQTENIRSSQSLVAHELVHQWFGDYVTCKDWSHLWLNEGFATYYEDLYDGHRNGRDSMLYGLYQTAQGILRNRPVERPIVWRGYGDAGEQFDYRSYSKGGWVLHMLRTELGEDLFRQCIKTYTERNALCCVQTPDLSSVVEALSGRSFDQFFDQWVYHAGVPKLSVSYKWFGTDKLAKVSIKQTQSINNDVLLFHLHTKLRFVVDGKPIDRAITIQEKEHDFYFPLEREPKTVRFDPDYGVLAQVAFDPPTEMLYAQLADQNDVVGRLLAIDALKEKKDKKTVANLKTCLNGDRFWGVRRAAARTLRDVHTDEAFDALSTSLQQKDARVRLQVIQDIGGFYRPESLQILQNTLEKEKNPDILAAAIENLGRYHTAPGDALVIRYLKSESYRNTLVSAAVRAIRMLDEPQFIKPLCEALKTQPKDWLRGRFGQALGVLAYIARNEEDKAEVRKFLEGYVNHPDRSVRAGAISALGTLGDPKATAVIQTFTSDQPRDNVERAARDALAELQQQKKLVPEEVIELRKVVDDLKKDTKMLTEELDDVKKRLDAKAESKPPQKSKPTGNDPNTR